MLITARVDYFLETDVSQILCISVFRIATFIYEML